MVVNQINWHPSRRTPYADRCPRIYSWVEQFVNELGGDLCRISVVRLNPHGRVYPHIDEGEYYKVRDRYHLVLRSPGGSKMNSGGEEVVFRDGELWWFNNKAVHDAFNPSAEGRIHVIFDVLPSRPTAGIWPGLEPPHRWSSRPSDAAFEDDAGGTDLPVELDTPGALSSAVRAILAGSNAGGRSVVAPGAGNRRRPGGAPPLGASGGVRLVERLETTGRVSARPGHSASATEHDHGQRAHALSGWPVPRTAPRGPGRMGATGIQTRARPLRL